MLTVFEEMREYRGFSKKMNENSSPTEDSKNCLRKPGHPFKAYSFCCCKISLGFVKICYHSSWDLARFLSKFPSMVSYETLRGVCLTCAKLCAIVCAAWVLSSVTAIAMFLVLYNKTIMFHMKNRA